MAERRPTIADVARQVGVSKTLVSFVFNDRPGVAPETRERILAAAKEMGWRPRPSARSLSTRRTFALGLVVRRDASVLTADSFFPAFIAGVETVLADEGQVLVLSVVPEARELGTYRTLVSDHRVDGVFLTDLRRADSRLPLLFELGLPAVTLGRPDSASTFPCIDLDDRPGVEQTVQHLQALGHSRIAYVAGEAAMLHGQRRRASFGAAMAAAGLGADMLEETDFSATEAALATDRLLRLTPRPTAIVYASDPMAVAGLGIIQARGLRCPDDMSVAGFDGADIARHIYPALTTVVSDPVAWGRSAARTLLQLIADGRANDVELPAAQLRVAQSTAPPTEPHTRPSTRTQQSVTT
jgi:DNA-binding LacI/PurR family transcriptional regulator